jgi:HTH-type transcriptional regulator/antitoxin HipB
MTMNQIARTPKQIGAIIQRQRRLKKLTQFDLAQRSGLRQEKISTIEAGRPGTRIDTICALLAALDLDITITPRSKGSPKDIEAIF